MVASRVGFGCGWRGRCWRCRLAGKGGAGRVRRGSTPDAGVIEQLAQRNGTLGVHRHRLHHRHAQSLAQGVGVDVQATALGQVHHVQGHHARQPKALDGQHQAQIASQVGGVHHADHQIRALLTLGVAIEHIHGHRLVQRTWMQAVGAWQVQQTQGLAGRCHQAAFLALDRHPGIVGHLLMTARQAVEKGGFAAIGVPDQGDQRPPAVHVNDRLFHEATFGSSTRTPMQSASARRKAKVESPTRTTSGSPPGMARAMICTCSPGMKPISASKRPHSGLCSGGVTSVTVARRCNGNWLSGPVAAVKV